MHYLPYAKLLISSLDLCPKVQLIVYRGVNISYEILLNGAQVGDIITRWSVISTSKDPRALKTPTFCNAAVTVTDGKVTDVQNLGIYGNVTPAPKTIVQVKACKAISVKQYSAEAHEDEFVLPPGSRFRVTAITYWRHGITEVRLTQLDDDDDGSDRIASVGTPVDVDFNSVDDYMVPDPEVDTNYTLINADSDIVYSSSFEPDAANYSTPDPLQSSTGEADC